MPDPSTTRLALYKSKSDGSELVNYPLDLGGNWDKVDLAVGFQAVTSTTRPSAPYSGKPIRETDTGRMYVSNGSAPASGSWLELATTSTTPMFTQGMTVTGLSLLTEGGFTTSTVFRGRVAGDTQSRLLMTGDGKLTWGSGTATGDVTLFRNAADELRTNDSLTVDGDLKVQGRAMGRGLLTMAQRTTDVTIPNATDSVLMAIPSATYVNGRSYRVTVWGYQIMGTAGSYCLYHLRKGTLASGTVIVDDMRLGSIVSTTSSTAVSIVFLVENTTGSDITTALNWSGSAATGTGTWHANTTATMSYITVEDIGLAADWPGAPLS